MASNQLHNLLHANSANPIVRRCLKAIESSEVKYSTWTVIPLSRALEVYSFRADINLSVNNRIIQGFDDLLASFEQAPKDCLVRLQSFELLSKWFTIFTDDTQLVLFGVLESPKKKVGWFDREIGYGS